MRSWRPLSGPGSWAAPTEAGPRLPLCVRPPVAYAGGAEKGGARVPKNEFESKFVTVAEVAASLRVSNMTVYRLIQSGQMAAVRVGRSYRIREADVDRYLADQYTQAG